MGIWPCRDRIAERGGLDLYGFCGNAPVSRVDRLGNLWGGPCSVNIWIGHRFDPQASIPERQLYPSEFYGYFCCWADDLNKNDSLPIGNSLFPYIPDIPEFWPDLSAGRDRASTLSLLEQISSFWCGTLSRLADGCQTVEPAMERHQCHCPQMALNGQSDRAGRANMQTLRERVAQYRNDPEFKAILSGSQCHALQVYPSLQKMWNEGIPNTLSMGVDCRQINREWSNYLEKYK